MSKIYRMMHDAQRHETRKLSYAKKSRELRIIDDTAANPLRRPTQAKVWFVAMTEPRREIAACEALQGAGWRVWYPQETIWRENAAKREKAKVNVPLFSRYVFISGEGAKPIGDCRHVSVLLPYRVPHSLIAELEVRQNGGEFKTADLPVYPTGQRVIASIGNIAALDGIVTHANHERVRIITEIFGSKREIDVPVDDVRAA
jgi:hypothetical protein